MKYIIILYIIYLLNINFKKKGEHKIPNFGNKNLRKKGRKND